MKKLFTLLVLLTSAAYVKAQDITVRNNSSVGIAILFGADASGARCSTHIDNTSVMYYVPPFTTYDYDVNPIPGSPNITINWMNPLQPNTRIRYARPHDGATISGGYDMWDPCTGLSTGSTAVWSGVTVTGAPNPWPGAPAGPIVLEFN